MLLPPGPAWTLDEGVWEEKRLFHSSVVSERRRREVDYQNKDPWKTARLRGKMKVTPESSQLSPQLLITPLQWDLIFLHAVPNMIHSNGEVRCSLVIIPGRMLNFKRVCALVVVHFCAAVNSFSHVPSIHLFYRACVCLLLSFFKAASFFFLLSTCLP